MAEGNPKSKDPLFSLGVSLGTNGVGFGVNAGPVKGNFSLSTPNFSGIRKKVINKTKTSYKNFRNKRRNNPLEDVEDDSTEIDVNPATESVPSDDVTNPLEEPDLTNTGGLSPASTSSQKTPSDPLKETVSLLTSKFAQELKDVKSLLSDTTSIKQILIDSIPTISADTITDIFSDLTSKLENSYSNAIKNASTKIQSILTQQGIDTQAALQTISDTTRSIQAIADSMSSILDSFNTFFQSVQQLIKNLAAATQNSQLIVKELKTIKLEWKKSLNTYTGLFLFQNYALQQILTTNLQLTTLVKNIDSKLPKQVTTPLLPLSTSITSTIIQRLYEDVTSQVFKGRTNDITKISQIHQNSKHALIHAFGGQGKTYLAARYCTLTSTNHSFIRWFNHSSQFESDIFLFYQDISSQGNQQYSPEDPIKNQIHRILLFLNRTPNWLLIFDNIDSHKELSLLSKFFPSFDSSENTGKIIVTSRYGLKGIPNKTSNFNSTFRYPTSTESINLESLDLQSSKDLFNEIRNQTTPIGPSTICLSDVSSNTTSNDEKTLEHIVQTQLGGCPLAITLAASFLKEHPSTTLTNYSNRIDKDFLQITNNHPEFKKYPTSSTSTSSDIDNDYFGDINKRFIALTLIPQFDFLAENHDEALFYLFILSYFGHTPIHLPLLNTIITTSKAPKPYPNRTNLKNPQKFESNIISPLTSLSLLTRSTTETLNDTGTIHSVISEVSRIFLKFRYHKNTTLIDNPPPPPGFVTYLVNFVTSWIPSPSQNFYENSNISLFEKILVYLLMSLSTLPIPNRLSPTLPLISNNILYFIKRFRSGILEFPNIQDKKYMEDFINVILNIALLYNENIQYSQSETLLREVYNICQHKYPQHPLLAKTINNLAFILQKQNKLSEAEPLLRKALEMRQLLYPITEYPSGHADLARSLNYLAHVLRKQNKLSEAESVSCKSLEMTQLLYPITEYPSGFPHLASSLNNLAFTLQEQNKLSEAETLYHKALEMTQLLYPITEYHSGHPHLASSLNNLAGILQEQNKLSEAEPLSRKALEMRQLLYPLTQYPFGHPDLASSLGNLASLLQKQNKLSEAEPLSRKALEMNQLLYPITEYPSGHPDLATSLDNLAIILQKQNKLSEAELLYRKSLEMNQLLYSKTEYPSGHPDLASSLNNLAIILSSQNKRTEAELLYRKSLEMNQLLYPITEYPSGHADLAISLNNLAIILSSQNKLTEAELLYRKALEMNQLLYSKTEYPSGHADLASSLNNLAIILSSQNKLTEAELLCRKALEMYQLLYPITEYPFGHPDLADSLNTLAIILLKQNNLPEAETLCRKALEMNQLLYPISEYPSGHPGMAPSVTVLVFILKKQNKISELASLPPSFFKCLLNFINQS